MEHTCFTEHYRRPPMLAGYTFPSEQACRACDAGRLLSIRLETNHSCNLSCRYCYAQGTDALTDEMDYTKLQDVICQAAELGAESIIIVGGGEPTLYAHFQDLVAFIAEHDMIPVVFSNTLKIDTELASFLYRHNASVMGKMDSLDRDVQDYLAGVTGAFDQIQAGLQTLMAAGFNSDDQQGCLRLGVSVVSCQMNLAEIEDIWRFCRDCGIFPNMEVLTPSDRVREALPDQSLSWKVIQRYRYRLLDVDRQEYGFDWLPCTPFAASGCLQPLYSLYITVAGNVLPCARTKLEQHPDLLENGVYPYNICRQSLQNIYDSPLFTYARRVDEHMEGKCAECLHLAQQRIETVHTRGKIVLVP